jgi:hypothetical protein
LATAKFGGILFKITPFENPNRLKKHERISVDAKTFEQYRKFTIFILASEFCILPARRTAGGATV